MIFLIMVLGLVVSFIALIFLHIDSLESYVNRDKYALKEYKVFFNTADIRSVTVFLNAILNDSNLPQIERLFVNTYIQDGDYILSGFYGSKLGYDIEVGNGFQDNNTIKNPVLVSNVFLNPNDLINITNASFRIMGQEYKVIGAGEFGVNDKVKNAPEATNFGYPTRQVIIPYSEFQEIAPDCSMVNIRFEHPLSSEEERYLKSEFNCRFSNEVLTIPVSGVKKHSTDIYITLFIIALGMGLSLVNIIALFRYWIERNWKKYYTYKLCGASGIWIYGLITCELIIVSIASFFVALLIYDLILRRIMTDNFVYYQLDFTKILLLMGISVLVSFVLVHPTAKRVAQMMPQEVKP
ncbi:MAG: hypothetical protein GX133_01470 [Syntrophomonadaceae bacterium]|nr:hypothetical protein [Syntrophomonadaceae bacterium]